MKIFTIATHEEGYLPQLKTTSLSLGFKLNILGENEKWGGFSWKINKYLQALKGLPAEEVIICTDAYDVFVVGTPQEVLEKYKSFNKTLVFSGQRKYATSKIFQKLANKVMSDDIFFNSSMLPPTKTSYRWPCTGLFMGPAGELVELFIKLLQLNVPTVGNDQILMTKYYLKYPTSIALDEDCHIFQNLWKTRGLVKGVFNVNDKDAEVRIKIIDGEKRPYNVMTNSSPCFVHGPYNVDLSPLMKEIGLSSKPLTWAKYFHYFRYSILYYMKRLLFIYRTQLFKRYFSKTSSKV